jgi:phosphoribosyl-AMP cyclohydrolase / phosphoribosyl-ATP pyrophosphohydrolase
MIIPSIDILGGRAVQLRQGRELVIDAGDPLAWLERFAIVGEVAVIDLDAALGRGTNRALIREMVRKAACRVGGGIRDHATARDWLDAGATLIIVGTAATPEFLRALPRDRVIAAVDCRHGRVVVNGWQTTTGRSALDVIPELAPHVNGFLLTQVEHEGVMRGFDRQLVQAAIRAAGRARVTAAGGVTTADDIATLDRDGADAQVGMALYSGALALGDAVGATLSPGTALWPTIVADESGRTLGLVWSNRESLRRAVEERAGVYWSRSRRSLWVKGESSGNRQQLRAVRLDCDRDALLFIVRQEGAGFCHQGTRSCFGDRFDLSALERVIASRASALDAPSATRRLLTEPGLLGAKLREEAGELAIAESPGEVTHEAADLMYLLLTAAGRAGVTLADIEAELGRRNRRITRRPMEVKAAP